jgi:hypothetical protein
MGSVLAIQGNSSPTVAFERKADGFRAEFQAPRNEQLLSPIAVIQNRRF